MTPRIALKKGLNSRQSVGALTLGCAVIFAALPQIAMSASFNVNPVGFELTTERPSGVLRIRNTGDDPVRIQVGAIDWSTDGSVEVLKATDALLLNPPIFTIAPGQTQFLRFGERDPANATSEKTYRLLIEEVPPSGPQPPGLKTLLKVSIPIFIAPPIKQEKMSWQLTQGPTGVMLTAINKGNFHQKIVRLQLNNIDSSNVLDIGTPAYVLSGQHKGWSLGNGKIHAGKVRVRIQTDKGESEENLTLEDKVPSR
ncbi:fimbria/pilus periplasmic chaperone [Glaciimonas sp. Gout2]|uniref:fimbrial biogenesis chaperone n=1 Tax=Glaciimonas sp. Gout2 TaxID=3048625 RepID=UPI002B2260BB|nr:fimbria/pilus periplasmic chaperone [Glaciimonas sp. Gout2]MEB0080629.1 fimbria/pilus periplasmic chaperone [Glaciimonas sp. Gout2]